MVAVGSGLATAAARAAARKWAGYRDSRSESQSSKNPG